MSYRPNCFLYSNDGFDDDVLINLSALYTSLGFRVYRSICGSPIGMPWCNLLVVARGTDIAVDSLPRNVPVHVYNYTGGDMRLILDKVKQNPCVLIAPSEAIQGMHCTGGHDHILSAPPVYPECWVSTSRSDEMTYDLVHIGHRKRLQEPTHDPFIDALDRLAAAGGVEVWGRGWSELGGDVKSHGPISVHEVSAIYARSFRAIGVMYPSQRVAGAVSGRFWHAPLNGALLLSEPSPWIGLIPGVDEVDYGRLDLPVTNRLPREEISNVSAHYWRNRTGALRDSLSEVLRAHPPTTTRAPRAFEMLVRPCSAGAEIARRLRRRYKEARGA